MFATHARRGCYVLAGLALNAELFNVWHFPAPGWYSRAVIQAVSFIVGVCGVLIFARNYFVEQDDDAAR